MEHDWYPQPLPKNVSLGPGSWLHSSHAFEHFRSSRPNALVTGRSCGLYIGTHFELGPNGRVSMGDYVNVTGAVFATNHDVQIGDHALISWSVVLADRFAPTPADVDFSPATVGQSDGDIVVGDGCWIGMRAVLLGGARLGKRVIVGASAVVDFEVPDDCMVAGNPPRIRPITPRRV